MGYVTLFVGTGLFDSIYLYMAVTTGLPSVISKLELLVYDIPKRTSFLALSVGGGLQGLLLALPFVTMRASAVAFFASTAVFALWFYFDFFTYSTGTVGSLFRRQHMDARRITLRAASIRGSASPCASSAAKATPVEAPGPAA